MHSEGGALAQQLGVSIEQPEGKPSARVVIAAQLLSNLVTADASCILPVWQALVPHRLAGLLASQSGFSLIRQPICSLLLRCCTCQPACCIALLAPESLAFLGPLLDAFSDREDLQAFDALALLVSHLVWQQGRLEQLFAVLSTPSSNDAGHTFGPRHVAVLELAALDMAHHTSRFSSLDKSSHAQGSLCYLLGLINQLAQQPALPPAQSALLEAALQLLRDACARDDGGAALSGGLDLAAELHAAGGVQLLLAMLKALTPIRSGVASRTAPPQQAEPAQALREAASCFPPRLPYPGFRSDLVAVLGNLAFSRPVVQATVQRLGGVELILSQCQIEDQNPLVREWALWAVRNLCCGNDAIQRSIQELQTWSTLLAVFLVASSRSVELETCNLWTSAAHPAIGRHAFSASAKVSGVCAQA
ncbi:hypothetical protein WJX72_002828 [[Myrmecia] bisecta]|uniref:Ataxin-10 domain-containing protein n=1 Tax=[Myrmecia] bisecta TaxID=41462 RepID=A0AAW1Q8F1_9CHLO